MLRKAFAIGLIAFGSCLFAQEGYGPKGPTVSVAPVPVVSVVQGRSASVPISFRVAPGYHINSNRPKSEFLIPTVLKIDATTDIAITKTTYPEGKDMSFAFSADEKLNVYTGDFQVDVRVRPLHDVPSGKYAVRGKLKYQACDNAACYPPKQLPVLFDVKIAKAPHATTHRNPAQSPHAHR
jgi:hypothetical protein